MARKTGTSPPAPAVLPVARLHGVVLLVEDEPSVRTVTRRMLETRGMTVLLAETPEEALDIAAGADRIDVLLTDVKLPGMAGPELAAQLRQGRPNLKIVYISGYAWEDAFPQPFADSSTDFIQKPFSPSQLAAVIEHILEGSLITPPPAAAPDTKKIPRPDTDLSDKHKKKK
jgi:CheY-like chemotaxis protein